MRSTFEPHEAARLVNEAGIDEVEDLGRAEFVPRYFGVAAPVRPGGGGHVLRARRT